MDLYDILGVRRDATAAEVRRAYQKRARQLHPDLNPGDPVAAERFRNVSRAFDVLSDPKRRAEYDRGEHGPAVAPERTAEVGFEGFDFSAELRATRVGFQEIFGGFVRGEVVQPQPGEDLEQATRVTFQECVTGTTRRVHVVRQDHCPICKGVGEVAFGPVPCPRCEGAGRIRASRGHMIFTRTCAECGGSGRLSHRPCARCAGDGRVMQSEWLEVKIPPGVTGGSRIRVPGCGNAGRRGGPPGDFVLVVEVEPHPVFRREGEDLSCVVPIRMVDAAMGGHVEVPTPDGSMTIEIPAGTQTGQRFRLRKRGLPLLGEKGRGDLWVEVSVQIPRVSDERGRELLRELARLEKPDGHGRS
jgi:molecular chaperone DnaJ